MHRNPREPHVAATSILDLVARAVFAMTAFLEKPLQARVSALQRPRGGPSPRAAAARPQAAGSSAAASRSRPIAARAGPGERPCVDGTVR